MPAIRRVFRRAGTLGIFDFFSLIEEFFSPLRYQLGREIREDKQMFQRLSVYQARLFPSCPFCLREKQSYENDFELNTIFMQVKLISNPVCILRPDSARANDEH